MERTISVGFLVLFSFGLCVLANTNNITPNFVETGECEGEEVCSYSYSAQQEYFNEEKKQNTEVNATIDITCISSGLYNDSDAKLYCMKTKDATIMSNIFENSSESEIRALQQSMNKLLSNWFCFVQSHNGKILAVYHSPNEPDDTVSLKKGIAAAFQANFLGSEEEEETDPQSVHKSHYTYTPTTEEGLLKMKRSIQKDDISEYSTEAVKEDIDMTKEEDIQYRSGKLERSSGRTSFHLVNDSLGEKDADMSTISLTELYSASGSYSIDLLSCRSLSKYKYGIQKRKIFSQLKHGSKEEDLKATINKEKQGIETMKSLRAKLPSGSAIKALRNYRKYGNKLIQVLQVLLELESQYGVLESYNSVIDDVMTFTANVPASSSDRELREGLIMLMSTEGSMKSQMALLSAYDSAMDDTEANTILAHVSFLKTAHIEFVIGMEERLNHPVNDRYGQLLLVFGSLATKGSDEVENRVMSYLNGVITALNNQTQLDLSDHILRLHALGNTGSKLSIDPIFSFLESSVDGDDYEDIKMAVIEALSKVTDNPVVLTKLEELLQEDPSIKCQAEIIETLENGFEYFEKSELDLSLYTDVVNSHTILPALAEAVALSNDTTLRNMMKHYLKKIKADIGILALIYNNGGSLGDRGKRDTTYWNSSLSDYNLVSELPDRQNDVLTYNHHRAYINSKRIGIDDANIKITYGYFTGTNTHCDSAKIYGRAQVVGKLLSRTSTFADIKVDVRVRTTSVSIVAYARIGRNVLIDYNARGRLTNNCFPYSINIANSRRHLFRLRFSLFIYVGFLTLRVDLYAHFNMDLNTKVCIGRTGTEVTGAMAVLTPTVGVTVSGGVEANLLYIAKGGITVSVTLNYSLEPAMSIQGCTAHCNLSGRLRLGIFDSFPNNNVRLDAWYRTRTVRTCRRGWLRYPCIKWGRRHTWDALSDSWNLGGRGRRPVYQICAGNLNPICREGQLNGLPFTC